MQALANAPPLGFGARTGGSADGEWLVSRLTYQGHQELARLRQAGKPNIMERG